MFKAWWGFLFRLFPCPTRVGLRKVGTPGRSSPVLVTCNFDLTVRRLAGKLEGVDAWLLVAESGGINVWCAAGAETFNTRSVVSAVKTSGVADEVDHRTLILPPLGAPGINADEVRRQTGWSVDWGPVRAADIPRYLARGRKRDEAMKRVTYNWRERLDTALGSMFPFWLLGLAGFAVFGRGLLLDYAWVSVSSFVLFILACPWIPGKEGIVKVVLANVVLGAAMVLVEFLYHWNSPFRADFIIAMTMVAVYGMELGGLTPNMKSSLDAWFTRAGIRALGNASFAGTVRGELLSGLRVLTFSGQRCIGCGCCVEICPLGLWDMGDDSRASPSRIGSCTSCRACLTQCPGGAIQAVPNRGRGKDVEPGERAC